MMYLVRIVRQEICRDSRGRPCLWHNEERHQAADWRVMYLVRQGWGQPARYRGRMTVMSGTPAYLQVAADLRAQIERGELSPGAQLPSSAQLRGIYAVSNTVIRDAIRELRRAGLVVGQQGKGVFVQSESGGAARPAPAEDLERRLAALEGQIAEPSSEVQSLRREVAILRTYIIDLYTRMGYPYPRETTEEPASGDAEPKLRRGGESNASRSA